MTTKIEWTWVPDGHGGRKKGETINVQVGCQEVSPTCRHCYAAVQAHLHAKNIPQHAGLTVVRENGVHWNGKINRVPKALAQPFHWREPRGVFVGSMTDTFFDIGTVEEMHWIAALFGVMAATPQHTYMLLTKRPEERIDAITDEDVAREGFQGKDAAWFIAMFCKAMGVGSLGIRRNGDGEKPVPMVTRIEFKLVELLVEPEPG